MLTAIALKFLLIYIFHLTVISYFNTFFFDISFDILLYNPLVMQILVPLCLFVGKFSILKVTSTVSKK